MCKETAVASFGQNSRVCSNKMTKSVQNLKLRGLDSNRSLPNTIKPRWHSVLCSTCASQWDTAVCDMRCRVLTVNTESRKFWKTKSLCPVDVRQSTRRQTAETKKSHYVIRSEYKRFRNNSRIYVPRSWKSSVIHDWHKRNFTRNLLRWDSSQYPSSSWTLEYNLVM